MAFKSRDGLVLGMPRLRRNLLRTGMFFENEARTARKTVCILVTLMSVPTSAVTSLAQAENSALSVANLDLNIVGVFQGETAAS